KSTCPGKGDCVPGKERWCMIRGADGQPDFTDRQWSTETCQPDGTWGPCHHAGRVPDESNPYCSQSPPQTFIGMDEPIFHYSFCCRMPGVCGERFHYCNPQRSQTGPISFGNCDGISCR